MNRIKKILLYGFYHNLALLFQGEDNYNEFYDSCFGTVNMTEMLKYVEDISDETRDQINVFYEKWKAYNESTEYSRDSVFVYLDEAFLSILDHELLSLLKSLNKDLKKIGYANIIDLKSLQRKTPTHEAILERVRYMHHLLY